MIKKLSILSMLLGLLVGLGLGYGLFRSTAQTEGSSKPFNNLHLIFFAGGSPDDPFAKIVHRGALAAGEIFGPRITFVWSNWHNEKMTQQFIDAIDAQPDGIAMMGHPGEGPLSDLIDEAFRKNIVVTTLNVPLPNSQATYAHKGFGYAGSLLYQAGATLADRTVRLFKIPEGSDALVLGVKSYPVRGKRTIGMIETLEKLGLRIHYLELSLDMRNNPEKHLRPELAKFFQDHPLPAVILADDNPTTSHVGKILEQLGLDHKKTRISGVDLTRSSLTAIEDGYLDLLLDQQPYLQGFLAVIQLCLSINYGFSGLQVDTGTSFIDHHNVSLIKSLVERGIR